jgi:hypothetical protein
MQYRRGRSTRNLASSKDIELARDVLYFDLGGALGVPPPPRVAAFLLPDGPALVVGRLLFCRIDRWTTSDIKTFRELGHARSRCLALTSPCSPHDCPDSDALLEMRSRLVRRFFFRSRPLSFARGRPFLSLRVAAPLPQEGRIGSIAPDPASTLTKRRVTQASNF